MKKTVAVTLTAVLMLGTSMFSSSAQARTQCRGYVGLTFDDGPTASSAALLQILKQYNDTATFFDIGANMQQYPGIVRAEAVRGQVANHTYSHPFLDELTYPQVYDELLGTSQIAQSITGRYPVLFRPPFDRLNDNVTSAQYSLGLLTALWSIDSQDYNGITPAQIETNVWNAKAGDVILFHDGLTNTLSALPAVLAHYQGEGLCGGEIIPSAVPHFAWSTQLYGDVVFYARVAPSGTPAPTVASLGLTPGQQSTAVTVTGGITGSVPQRTTKTSPFSGRHPE